MLRFLANFFGLLGVCLLVASGYLYWSGADGPRLEVPEPAIEVSGCAPGKEAEVSFHLHNHSSQPVRVIGVEGC
jgi:hypothetical protein